MDARPTNSPYDGGSDATDTATDVARGTAHTDAAERNLADDGGAPRSRSSARSDQYGHDSPRPDVRSRDAAPSSPVGASPQKMQHLDRDLAMGWLIRQDAPQAKEIRDYIDRLRVLVRERERLEEQLQTTERNLQESVAQEHETFQKLREANEQYAVMEENLRAYSQTILDLKEQLEAVERERDHFSHECDRMFAQKVDAESELSSLREQIQSAEEARARLEDTVARYEARAFRAEKQLEAQRELLQRIYDNERVWRVLPNTIAENIFAAIAESSPAIERHKYEDPGLSREEIMGLDSAPASSGSYDEPPRLRANQPGKMRQE